MTRLLLFALLLNCQVSNPTLVDEFVHGEVQFIRGVLMRARSSTRNSFRLVKIFLTET